MLHSARLKAKGPACAGPLLSDIDRGLFERLGSLEGDLVGFFAVDFALDGRGETATRSPSQFSSAVVHVIGDCDTVVTNGGAIGVKTSSRYATTKISADFAGCLDSFGQSSNDLDSDLSRVEII